MKSLALLVCLFSGYLSNAQDSYKKGVEAFNAKDYAKAAELLRDYADKGDCMAQYVVGFAYSDDRTDMYNDSIAFEYLLKAAEQKHTHSMGLLAGIYFGRGGENIQARIDALTWAELAASYDIVQQGLSTRHLIRNYLTADEIKQAEKQIKEKKKVFDKMEVCDSH